MEMTLSKEDIEEILRKYYTEKGLLIGNIEVKQVGSDDIQAKVILKSKNIELLTKEDKVLNENRASINT